MAKDDTDPLDFIEWEDDEGNVYRRKASKADLKDMLRRANERTEKAERAVGRANTAAHNERAAAAALQRRLDNVALGLRIAEALGDQYVVAVDATIDIQQDFVDVSTYDEVRTLPGLRTATLKVTFTGDPQGLSSLADALLASGRGT